MLESFEPNEKTPLVVAADDEETAVANGLTFGAAEPD